MTNKNYNPTTPDQYSLAPLATPIIGRDAIFLQLRKLGRDPAGAAQTVIKVDNKLLYALELTGSGLRITRLFNPTPEGGGALYHPSPNHSCKVFRFSQSKQDIKEDGISYLEGLAETGEVFIIPNYIPLNPDGDNGIGANFVTRFTTFFVEIDNLSIPSQWARINWFASVTGLVPALVVFSGGKSLHVYYVLKTPIADKQRWQTIQRKLILLFHSDPQIQNPNREMRLAGVNRIRKNQYQSIQYHSDRSYDVEDIEERLDATRLFPFGLNYDRWLEACRDWYRTENDTRTHTEKETALEAILTAEKEDLTPLPLPNPSYMPSPVAPSGPALGDISEQFPLEICLTRDDRALIASGVSEGGRNSSGAKLARNLIATAERLTARGYSFHGLPRGLFEEYCDRCTPSISCRERQQIWRSAVASNPSPSLTDEAIDHCIRAWQWHQRPEAQNRKNKNLEEGIASSEFLDWFKSKTARLSKHFRKGFGIFTKKVTSIELPKTIPYSPDAPLPNPEDNAPIRRLTFKKGQRLGAGMALNQKGWKIVLDRSFMGSGKSHDWGQIALAPDSNSKVWYLSRDHRNPTTETVEANFTDLDVRHNGLVKDPVRLTPLGEPHLHWAPFDVDPDINGLCCNAELFLNLKNKGYNADNKMDDGVNPICAGCKYHKIKSSDGKSLCATEKGDGYGFKYARGKTLAKPNIRASINSLPAPEDYDYSNDIAIVDETSEIKATRTVTATSKDFEKKISELAIKFSETFERLRPFVTAIANLFQAQDLPRHGLNHQKLLELFPSVPIDLPDIIEKIRESQPKIQDLIVEPDSVSGCGGKWRNLGEFTRSHFRKEAARETRENLENLPSNFLIDLLEVWGGVKAGAIRFNHKQLEIVTPDPTHALLLKSFKFVVLLDATASIEQLAKKLDIDPDNIIEMMQEMPSMANLEVHGVQMEGMGSSQWSDKCINRSKALIEHLEQQHPNIPVLGVKRYKESLQLSGWWFNHNRGSNEFKGQRAIAAFGSPYINLGICQDEYLTLYGTLDGFDRHYQQLIEAEILQLVGRQRAHLYPFEKFTLYLVGTDLELDFLATYGIRVTHKQAFELCPEAGTDRQKNNWATIRVFQEAFRVGREIEKLTQTEVATAIGISQGRLSQIVREMGGWRGLRKLLGSLVKEIYREPNNCFSMHKYYRAILDLPPLETARSIVEVINDCGWKDFVDVLKLSPPPDVLGVLGVILGIIVPPKIFAFEGVGGSDKSPPPDAFVSQIVRDKGGVGEDSENY